MTDRGTVEREAALQRDTAAREEEDTQDATANAEPRADARDEPVPDRGGRAALFDASTASELERRWQTVQVGFVDEPRDAVEQADQLVAEVLDQLTSSFARERRDLEAAWSDGRQASTEDLRQAIRRYRSFFDRLLAV